MVDFTPPGCNPGETGSASVVNNDTGEVCETVFGTAGNSTDCNNIVPATFIISLILNEGSTCETTYSQNITIPCDSNFGCTDTSACNFDPNALCEDGSCVTQCCPQPISDNIPRATCSICPRFCIELDGNVSDITNFQNI